MTTEYIRNCITGLSLLWLIPSSIYFWLFILKYESQNKINLYDKLLIIPKEKRQKNDKKN